jgi:hypothetical protein
LANRGTTEQNNRGLKKLFGHQFGPSEFERVVESCLDKFCCIEQRGVRKVGDNCLVADKGSTLRCFLMPDCITKLKKECDSQSGIDNQNKQKNTVQGSVPRDRPSVEHGKVISLIEDKTIKFNSPITFQNCSHPKKRPAAS